MAFCSGIFFLDTLGKIRRGYSHALEPVCRRWDLTRNALDVLLFLHNNPEFDRAADLVSRRGIAKSHVSLAVSQLEARGLLVRVFRQEDRRTAHLQLTAPGSAIAREGQAVQEQFFSRLYGGIPRTKLEAQQQLLKQIRANMDRMEQECERSL